jgi:hypothetical protein
MSEWSAQRALNKLNFVEASTGDEQRNTPARGKNDSQ